MLFYESLPYHRSFIGAQIQRLAHLLNEQGGALFADAGLLTPTACASSLLLLSKRGPASLTEIAGALGEQHQLIAHRVKQLEKLKLVSRRRDPIDQRRRTIHLTSKGNQEVPIIEERCQLAMAAFERVNQEIGCDLSEALDQAYGALKHQPLLTRANELAK